MRHRLEFLRRHLLTRRGDVELVEIRSAKRDAGGVLRGNGDVTIDPPAEADLNVELLVDGKVIAKALPS